MTLMEPAARISPRSLSIVPPGAPRTSGGGAILRAAPGPCNTHVPPVTWTDHGAGDVIGYRREPFGYEGSAHGKRQQGHSDRKSRAGSGSALHAERLGGGELHPGHQRGLDRQGRRASGANGVAPHRRLG